MDYKSRLQEIVQQTNSGQLQYEVIEEKGPAHAKVFVTVVRLSEMSSLEKAAGNRKKKQNKKLLAMQSRN